MNIISEKSTNCFTACSAMCHGRLSTYYCLFSIFTIAYSRLSFLLSFILRLRL